MPYALLTKLFHTLGLFLVLGRTISAHADGTQPYLSGRPFCNRFPSLMKMEGGTYIKVPLNYLQPNGDTTEIYTYFLRGFDPNRPTVAVFTGGPGDSSHFPGSSAYRLSGFLSLSSNILMFDQRGIACSHPELESTYRSPGFYSSESTARDLEEIRKHFDLPKLSIWGGSYGTVPATIYANLFPNQTKAVVLEGVVYDGSDGVMAQAKAPNQQIQAYFDGLPPAIRTRFIDLTQKGILSPADFTLPFALATSGAGQYGYPSLNKLFASIFLASDDKIKKVMDQNVLPFFFPELVQPVQQDYSELENGDSIVNEILLCKELGVSEPGAFTENYTLKGNQIIPDYSAEYGEICKNLGMRSPQHSTYSAKNYPITRPVSYIQGTDDALTPMIGAITHFHEVPKGLAQIVLVAGVGHVPSAWLDNQLTVNSSPEKICFENMFKMLTEGKILQPSYVSQCSASGEYQFQLIQK